MRDETRAVARRIARSLHEGERVLAAVALALPGTGAAALSGAALAADGAPAFPEDDTFAASRAAASKAGVRAGTRFYLAVTSQRVVLHRRSVLGRPAEVVLDTPLEHVQGVATSKQGHGVILQFVDGRSLRLETPKAFKFLPDVYGRLPQIVATAKEHASR